MNSKIDLILSLEEKFAKLDTKLNSINTKTEHINIIYNKNCDAIDELFTLEQEKYENGLNGCRDVMLKQKIKIKFKFKFLFFKLKT